LYLLSILISDPELLEVITDLQGFEGQETDDHCEADQPGEIEPGLKTGKQKKSVAVASLRIVLPVTGRRRRVKCLLASVFIKLKSLIAYCHKSCNVLKLLNRY